jgi:hypothetical protein
MVLYVTGIGTGIYIKMTFLLILHRKNKKFEGLLQNFKNVALFEIVVQTGISIHKNFFFGTIFVLRRAKFLLTVGKQGERGEAKIRSRQTRLNAVDER